MVITVLFFFLFYTFFELLFVDSVLVCHTHKKKNRSNVLKGRCIWKLVGIIFVFWFFEFKFEMHLAVEQMQNECKQLDGRELKTVLNKR